MKIMEKLNIDFAEREIIDNMVKFCWNIQSNCRDEELVDIATEVLEKIEKLEEYIV